MNHLHVFDLCKHLIFFFNYTIVNITPKGHNVVSIFSSDKIKFYVCILTVFNTICILKCHRVILRISHLNVQPIKH